MAGKKAPVKRDVKKTVEVSEENGAFLAGLPWGMQKRLVNSLLDEARKVNEAKGRVGLTLIMEGDVVLMDKEIEGCKQM